MERQPRRAIQLVKSGEFRLLYCKGSIDELVRVLSMKFGLDSTDNGDHTNSIEGYWRLSKHKLYARYHRISVKYLPDYLAESEFKFNERSQPDFIRLVLSKLLQVP